MFTGIVQEMGTVRRAERQADLLALEVAARLVVADMAPGDSVAVNGCCLTAVQVGAEGFACQLTPETLARTAFGERLRPGALVNLERPLRAEGRFEGHIVQGHVDGVGRVLELRRRGDSAELAVEAPGDLRRYLAPKGSVAVEGVSLTVTVLGPSGFSAALIPYTLARTNLGQARPGDPVNLEMDVLAKYLERLLEAQGR